MISTTVARLGQPLSLAAEARSLLAETLAWISQHTLQIVLGAAAGAIIVALLWGLRAVGGLLCRSDQGGARWRTVFGRVLAKTSFWFALLVAAEMVTGYMNPPQQVRSTVHFLFVIAIVLQGAVWLREFIMGLIEHRAGGPDPHGALGSALGVINVLLSIGLFAIAGLTILSNLGVNVTGLVAGLGIGGIAIGLAAQGIFADLFAALSILFDRPFRRGDTIKYGTTTGSVEAIGLKSTRLRAITGEEVVISNTNLLGKELHNMARLDHRRTVMTLGLTYEAPRDKLARVPDMMREIVEAEEHCFLVRCGLQAFNTSSLDFQLEYDVRSSTFDVVFEARHRINMAILERFAAEGIAFAYPTQVSYAANPDGTLVAPYPHVQMVDTVDADDRPEPAPSRFPRFLTRT